MKLEDCGPDTIVHLTPGLIPIMGEGWKVGSWPGMYQTRLVYPVVWRDCEWRIDNLRKTMLLDRKTEVQPLY